jgi:hypothetical protein
MSEIELPADLPGPWEAVGELVELLPADWVLIGGLMVQLHAWEGGMTDVRATVDVDVLGEARPQRALQAIDAPRLSGRGSSRRRPTSTATRTGTSATN